MPPSLSAALGEAAPVCLLAWLLRRCCTARVAKQRQRLMAQLSPGISCRRPPLVIWLRTAAGSGAAVRRTAAAAGVAAAPPAPRCSDRRGPRAGPAGPGERTGPLRQRGPAAAPPSPLSVLSPQAGRAPPVPGEARRREAARRRCLCNTSSITTPTWPRRCWRARS